MTWIKYLLEANLYLVLFYAGYYLLLRRETHYQLNRLYLLGCILLAFTIPLLQLGFLKPAPEVIQRIITPPVITAYQPVIMPSQTVITPIVNTTFKTAPVNPINYYLLAYIVVAVTMAVSLVIRLYQLTKLARKGKHVVANRVNLIELEDDEHAFSFFSYLFISKKLTSSATIIQHELVHIQQRHSLDIMYLEVIKIICWFNPIVYLMQNSVKELHEFIADSKIAGAQQDVNHYTDFLINNAYGLPEMAITNNFFIKNLLKKRIMMLHQKRSGNVARLKYLVALPLLAGMLCLSTLGFTKDYPVFDLAPKSAFKNISKAKPTPKAQQTAKFNMPPLPIGLFPASTTSKGYKYKQISYLVDLKGKLDHQVVITEKDGTKTTYLKSTATAAQVKLLAKKYGYVFPKNTHTDKPVNFTKTTAPPSNIDSLFGPKSPLYVIDGVALTRDNAAQFGYDPKAKTDMLAMIPQDHIANMEILKDGTAVSLYGDRGKNGVIKVTTWLGKAKANQEKALRYPLLFIDGIEQTLPAALNITDNTELLKAVSAKIPQEKFLHAEILNSDAAMALYGDRGKHGATKIETTGFPPTEGLKGHISTDDQQIRDFLSNLYVKYPAKARENGISGKMSVIIQVSTDHRINNLTIYQGLTDEINDEVIKAVIGKTPPSSLYPGKYYILPFVFTLKGPNDNNPLEVKPNTQALNRVFPDGFIANELPATIVRGYNSNAAHK